MLSFAVSEPIYNPPDTNPKYLVRLIVNRKKCTLVDYNLVFTMDLRRRDPTPPPTPPLSVPLIKNLFVRKKFCYFFIVLILSNSEFSLIKVIWRIAGPVPKNLGANTKTMKWLPQFDLLGHSQTRVFVSHCGMNGMNEGAFHGVPVLAMPLYGDQLNNAQQLVHAGMAIAIFRKRFLGFVSNPFNADDVVQAIEQLMHDPR